MRMTSDQALLESDVKLNSADNLSSFSTGSLKECTEKETKTTIEAEEILERLVEVCLQHPLDDFKSERTEN